MSLANAVALIGVGGVLAGSRPALATDLNQSRPLARMAAIESAQEGPQYDTGFRAHRNKLNADLKLLLAQGGSQTQVEAAAHNNTILVAVALSEPYSVDEHIAEQHSLVLVDRTDLSSFGLRIVRYRIPDDRPLGPIIAGLQKDQRIGSVQANVEYRLPRQSGSTQESRSGAEEQANQYDPHSEPGAVSQPAKAAQASKRSLTYERRRRQLVDQLAAAETARRLAVEQLEEFEDSHTRETLRISGGSSASPMADRQDARPWTRAADSSQRASLGRRCAEIKADPDGYERALVDLCRTM